MHTLYLSPDGNDSWSGTLPAPNAAKTDGPLLTLPKARDLLRAAKKSARLAGPATVYLRGGRYPLKAPITFTPEDSYPTTFAPYKNETPILDGGQPLTDLREEILNGRRVWIADLPEVQAGTWYFRDLYVNAQRRPRTRLPKKGYYQIADVPGINPKTAQLFEGSSAFLAQPGDLQPYHNLTDVEILCHHYWVEERLPIASFDPATNRVLSSRRSIFVLRKGFASDWAQYCVENVFEALDEPGQWYLDRPTGRFYYLPLPNEKLAVTTLVAPRTTQFILLQGDPDKNAYVEFLSFQGIHFVFSDWRQTSGTLPEHDSSRLIPTVEYGSDGQAAITVPGTIQLTGARNCAIENCTFSHLGWYAVELAAGCLSNRIVGNTMFDLGAGGVKLNGANASQPLCRRTGHNRITDNHIHHIGEVFKPAIGVLSAHAFGNTIAHNHIHHTHYSGISVGWVWGYADSVSKDNHIDFNHIHHIGRGVLSDMGGIYTLGVQPGTTIRNNLIHDITTCEYGGWAIYPDEGSSHLLIENNVCYHTDSSVFHTHYGREIIVRNNIFAFGREGIVALSRAEEHNSYTFSHNILVAADQPIHMAGYNSDYASPRFLSDHNLLFDTTRKTLVAGALPKHRGGKSYSLAQFQSCGLECHSLVANPRFRNLEKFDFTLQKNSPALALGFHPIDLSTVGPRPPSHRD